ncbi:MAG: two-component regulator propeller domain-containing protein, partial [Chitinophagales bacterium]
MKIKFIILLAILIKNAGITTPAVYLKTLYYMHKTHWLFIICILLLQGLSAQQDVNFTRYSQEEGLSAVTFREIFEDGEGFIWIATEQGINRFDGYSFKTFKHDPSDPNSIAENKPNIILYDSAKNPIFITDKYISIYLSRDQKFKNYKLPDHLSGPQKFKNPQSDYRHNLCWFLTNNKLICFNPVNGEFIDYVLPLNGEEFNSFYVVFDYIFLLRSNGDVIMKGFDLKKKNFFDYALPDTSELARTGGGYMWCRESAIQYSNYPHEIKTFFTGNNFVIFNENDPLHPTLYTPKHTWADYNYLRINLVGEDEAWIGTTHGKIISINFKTGQEKVYDVNVNNIPNRSDNAVYSVARDEDGEMWATTDGLGLIRIDPSTGNIIQYLNIPGNPNSVWSNSCSAVIKHSSGVLLVTAVSKGLLKIEKQKKIFRTYIPLNAGALSGKLLSDDIRAVLALDSDQLLTGTLTNLCVINKNTGNSEFVKNKNNAVVIPELTKPGYYTAAVKDKKGNIIIGTWNGKYFAYNSATAFYKEYSVETGFPMDEWGRQTRSMLIDSKNNLWLATDEMVGIVNVDSFLNAEPSTLKIIKIPTGVNKKNCITGVPAYSLFEDKNKNIWAGTASGLNKISPDGSITQYLNDPEDLNSLNENNVRCVAEDNAGNIWIGTNGGGINKFDQKTGKFSFYTLQTGLPDDAIYTIQFDDEDNLWLASNRGLARLNISTGTTIKFTPHDGLQNYEYNTNAFCKMPGGELVFGGTSGLNIFDPKTIINRTSPPKISLCSFLIFNKEVSLPPSGIKVSHDQNNFTFEFAAMSFYRNSENQYAYKMEEFDDDWIYCDNRHLITYNNIPPGNYIFRIKGSNNAGEWNEEGISFPITILPPWWQTWWARVIAFMVSLSVILLFVQYRTKTLRKQQVALEQKVDERTDELKASQLQLVQQEKLASLGQLTAGIAHEIKNPLNFVNNFSDLSSELIEEFEQSNDEKEKKELLNDLKINLKKISHHGKRADSIVKNMLQHSRGVSGEKRLTNINELADEFLNLSYHGMRATLENFNCRVVREFDPEQPEINIIPQDISRVLLNLFNNAFYAVNTRAKTAGNNYQPEVIVTTKELHDHILITVRDNGSGIPETVKE